MMPKHLSLLDTPIVAQIIMIFALPEEPTVNTSVTVLYV